MSLFDKIFRSNKIEIVSPVDGEIVPIQQVSDPTFSREMVGKGVAIIPSDGKFYAPADGMLISLFPTGHAFCINTNDGVELLVHVGIDTVKLEGEFYTIHGVQGKEVKKGDLIIEVNLQGVIDSGFDTITPVVISNYGKFAKLEKKTGVVAAGDPIILLGK